MWQRLLYRSYRALYRLAHWTSRKFTPAGLLALGGLGLTGMFGLDTNRTMSYQAFAFLFCLLLVGLVWTLFSRARFSVVRHLPRFATAGQPLAYRIEIRNESARVRDGLAITEEFAEPYPGFHEFVEAPEARNRAGALLDRLTGLARWRSRMSQRRPPAVREQPLPPLPPRGRAEARLEFTPTHRGRLVFTGLNVSRTDPFGLLRHGTIAACPQSVLVLPQRYPVPPLDLPGHRRHQPGGVALASSVGDSEEFVSLRDYRPGDPLRRIHWRTWAKTGRPIVKEYQEEYFVRHALVLDTFQGAPAGSVFEAAVSVAASFAATVHTQETLLDLMFVGTEAYCFTSGRGLGQTDRMLEILASVRVCREKPFDSLLPLILARVALLSSCICVLLNWDQSRRELVRQLTGLGLPVKILVILPADASGDLDPGPLEGRPRDLLALKVGRIEEGLAGL
jgi:uncharacterized protein (DUF58 family)